jgi:hypothetical protein
MYDPEKILAEMHRLRMLLLPYLETHEEYIAYGEMEDALYRLSQSFGGKNRLTN